MGLHLPAAERIRGDVVKVALRRVAARWLPAGILERGKHGFILPMESWLREWFEAQDGPAEYFRAAAVPGLDVQTASGLADADLRRGVARPRLLFALVALAEWHRAFVVRLRDIQDRVDAVGNAAAVGRAAWPPLP